jgi:translation initiation factor 4E
MPQTPIPSTPGVAAAQGWMEDIKRVISFDSVEEFWGYVLFPLSLLTILPETNQPRLYNNIVPPSQLPQKANYYLFKVDATLPLSKPSLMTIYIGGNNSCLGR